MRNEELLIRLTQTQGIAGYEKKVRELIEQEALSIIFICFHAVSYVAQMS